MDIWTVPSRVSLAQISPISSNEMRRYVRTWINGVGGWGVAITSYDVSGVCPIPHVPDNVVDRVLAVEVRVLRGAFVFPPIASGLTSSVI